MRWRSECGGRRKASVSPEQFNTLNVVVYLLLTTRCAQSIPRWERRWVTQCSTPWPRSSAAGLPGGRSLMELLQIHARRPPGLCRPRSEHRGVRQRLPARGVPRTPDPTRSGCACGGESRSGRVFEQRPFLRGWVPRGGMGGGSDPLVVRRVPSSRLGSGGAGSDALLQPRHPLRALRNGHRTGAGTLTLSFAARRRGSADAHPPGDGGRGGRFAFGARRGRPSRLRRGESCGGTPCPAAPCGRFPAVLQLCSQVSPRRLFPLRQLHLPYTDAAL